MEFLDFQTFSTADNDTIEDNILPEPVQRLALSVASTKHRDVNAEDIPLPSILKSKAKNNSSAPNEHAGGLHQKMEEYVNLSIKELGKTEGEHAPSSISPFGSSTSSSMDINKIVNEANGMGPTDLILSKKLSNVLNNFNLNNYQSALKLRNALKLLENLQNTGLSLDRESLITPDYVGTLSRKNLRNDLETELLKEHIIVLEEFRPIVRRIKRLSTSIENIRDVSESILPNPSINENDTETTFLKDIDKIRAQMDQLKLKKELLLAIKDKFTIDQVEDDIIQNSPVDERFFEVVEKVELIKDNASCLFSLPDSSAGTALLTRLNDTTQTINRKIYNHLLDFLYSYDNGQNSEQLPLFQKSLAYLSNDLTYFNEFLKRVTKERSKLILDEFLSQFDLNVKDKRPIVLNAHDPIRYVGDVLASVHALIANEADFVRTLFDFTNSENGMADLNNEFLQGLDVKLLNEIVKSLANSCRIRIEQVVRFEESCIINFEIIQLLKLYKLMFVKKQIKATNPLVVNLGTLHTVAHEKIVEYFVKLLKGSAETAESSDQSDLLPPTWLSDYVSQVVEFLEVYEKSLSNVDDDNDDEEIEKEKTTLEEIVAKIVEYPFEDFLAKQLQSAFPSAKKHEETQLAFLTMQLNCFDLIKTRLQIFSTSIFSKTEKCQRVLQNINNKLTISIEQMRELQTKFLFEKTGLGMYNNLLNMIFPIDQVKDELDYNMYFSLNDNGLMALPTIRSNVHDKLNEYLPQALTDVQENLLFKLASPTIASEISEYCFSKLSHFYCIFRRVLNHINPDNEDEVGTILNFSEDEFNMLVGIED
ncbi:Golgi transport complex subunit COG6 KNAG_0H02100 [Huiozyma naganishii CBS 8797]|uniref:Conserved oligomeric Golgi complex subunit 6 n=1 Tax=Huiozyma naganishii (strain ATCC MYA-139 / BCRC 22969 / CBS 8797 / KCTC 17520 / NBRC 10181 / NCYC 3082 / Yp74L-3) TaxID=1071383 RepID=J7S8L6_HUIN7|nr:hypothetical protein KNAG_0H02100 [Kazachstania naganishii CBS 8797]CCK71624.1 hypothetical protein KNAG_0H02100 [Kazachstania naganishii CBS 8797]